MIEANKRKAKGGGMYIEDIQRLVIERLKCSRLYFGA
jgi:hypothetical protein